jgi:N-acetylmuramoyl-L-alanine amidase
LGYLSVMLRLILFSTLFFSVATQAQPPTRNFITGRTTGTLPYLNYGLGEDRLGGAKMSYLDTNIVVKVVDSVLGHYKVQLSQQHFAYLPIIHFKPDSVPVTRPYYLTNSWRVYGDSLYDYVSVMLDEQLPYQSQQLTDPAAITVDVFGATNNTNWVTQLSSAKEVKAVSHEQTEDDVFRITIRLQHQHHWGYSIYYEGKRLVIRIKRQPVLLDITNMKIAVDAGHGGSNSGASGVKTRILEKDYTLKIAKELQAALLNEGADVYMTRETDIALGMNERWLMVKEQSPDFLISIHLNSSVKDSIQGVSTYYRYPGFRPLTQFILDRMLETGLKEFGNIGSFNFTLNGPTDFPNCLMEVAFLSNKEDEQRILDPAFHKEVAQKIVAGIKDWLEAVKE